MSYMAPEIHLGKAYKGELVDTFAAAIILFIMLSQRPPFGSAAQSDPHYQLLAAGRADLFWKAHEQCKGSDNLFSSDFKDLFEKMTCLNPKQRLTAEQALKHSWLKAPAANQGDLFKEFSQRKEKVDEKVKKEQDERRKERAQANNAVGKIRVRRGHAEDCEELDEFKLEEAKLELLPFDEYCQAKQTQFFSSSMCTLIFRDLIKYLQNNNIKDYCVSRNQWKLKFSVPEKNLKVTCSILHVDLNKVCVEFVRPFGDQLAFFSLYQDIEKHLQMHNDLTH